MTVERGSGRRILYITNGFPYPLTSGYLRHWFLIGELAAAGHRVTLLSVVGADHLPEHAEAMRERTERVEVFRSRDRAAGSRQRLLRRLRRAFPFGGDPATVALAARAGTLAASGEVDAVVFSGKRTDAALAGLRDLPVVVDMCDATSLRLARESAVAPPSRRIVLAAQMARVRRTERRMLQRADRLLFASERDREALLPHAGDDPRAAVVPNGVDLAFWQRRSPSLGSGSIVLTGAMSYGPNVDAAVRLARTILPLVRRSAPEATLAIVGRDPTPDVRGLTDIDGVTVTGWVEDVRPYLETASVFAAPLRFGAGIQNKLLEAMAMEVPVVSSALAADGLRTPDGATPPIAVHDDDASVARALVEALHRAERDPRPDREARDYVARHFSWERSGQTLLGLLDGAIGDRQGARAIRPGAARAVR